MRKLIPQQMARNGRDETTQPRAPDWVSERASDLLPSTAHDTQDKELCDRANAPPSERAIERASDRAKGL